MKSRHPRSLFLHIVFVLSAAALVVGLLFFFYARNSGVDHRRDFLRHVDAYTQSLARQLGSPPSQTAAQETARELHIEIGFMDQNGQWLWKTNPELPPVNELKQESRMRHREIGVGFYQKWAFRIMPVQGGNLVFFLEAPGKWARGFAPLLGLICLIFLFTWGMIRHLLKPLRQLETAVERVGQGDFQTVLKPTRPREFYKVAAGFNLMVDKIAGMIREKEQILRDVSHELRTPLARLKLSLALLPESGERRAMEEDIRELEALVGEILEAAKIDVEEQSGRPRPTGTFNLIDPLRRAAESVSLIYPHTAFILSLSGKRATIRGGAVTGGISATWTAAGEPEHFLRLFRNLIENAAKHTPSEAAVEISGCREKENFVLEFADEGPGIPEKYQDKIFEPFFQINRTTDRAGYGLGLYLCKKIITRYGGGISVENRPGRGTLFRITLPALHEPEPGKTRSLTFKNKRTDPPES